MKSQNRKHWEENKVATLERRSAQRFPIERALRFKAFGRQGIQEPGCGRTINISSSGILFTTDCDLVPGRRIEVTVSWPERLNENCALQLVARGRIVRVEPGRAALEFHQHEFRTARAGMFSETKAC